MERELILDLLTQAKNRLAGSERLIARQNELIAVLRLSGRDTSAAEAFLAELQSHQASCMLDTNRLLAELKSPSMQMPPGWFSPMKSKR